MALVRRRLTGYNVRSHTFQQPDDTSDYFCLLAPPDSVIWRSIRTGDALSAPMLLTRVEPPFAIAEVTISVGLEEIWDQAGMVLFLDMSPDEPWTASFPPLPSRRRLPPVQLPTLEHRGKWVKACLQLNGDDIGLATVVAHPKCGPDMSFVKICTDFTDRPRFRSNINSIRIKMERVGDDLWIWYRNADLLPLPQHHGSLTPAEASSEWSRVREVSGFFTSADAGKAGVLVGCYASRPVELEDEEEPEKKDLFVEFEELEVL